jgi:hypothetical protein
MRRHEYRDPYDQRTDDLYEAEFEDFGGPTAGLVSYPASVESHLAHMQGLARQGRAESALAVLQGAAGVELARASAELFALAVALGMGRRGLTFEELEIDRTVTETEHRVLGVRVGSSVTTTTRMKQRRRGYGAF